MQLKERKRGFSFRKEGPLDMRMDTSSDLKADEIVNKWSEKDLGNLFRDLGEEPRWRKAAKAVVRARRKKRIETTTELADIVTDSLGRSSKKKLHGATLVFQALRMCVNKELESIQEGVTKALKILAPGGRIGVLSFHRLEDRIVKNVFRSSSKPMDKMSDVKESHLMPLMQILTKKPLVASREEVRANPRSRSAKMRFAQKVK